MNMEIYPERDYNTNIMLDIFYPSAAQAVVNSDALQ